jgi:nucleotide-binding universal stress UspA family protein
MLEGNPAREIVEHAKRCGADLVCMGTHGRGGLNRLLLGSVAERVVRASEVPVLTVRVGEGE